MYSDARDRWYAVLVTVIVIALVGAVIVWRQRPGDTVGRAVGDDPSPAAQRKNGAPRSVTFTADGHGYALVSDCATDGVWFCTDWLDVSVDAGGTWARRDLPVAADLGEVAGWSLHALAGNGVVVQFSVYRGGAVGSIVRRWFSADSGRTWQERSRTPTATVDEIPDGGRLIYEWVSADGYIRPHALRPDGTAVWLRTVPVDAAGQPLSVEVPDNPAPPAGDGSVWISGDLPWSDDHTEQVVVSRDRGRTWQTVRTYDTPGPSAKLYTGDGRSVFLARYSARSLEWFEHSPDGGATWHDMLLPPGFSEAFSLRDTPPLPGSLAFVDGHLLAEVDGRLYRSTADGSAFEEVTGNPPLWSVAGAGTKVVGIPAGPDVDLLAPYVSDDGVTWRPIALP